MDAAQQIQKLERPPWIWRPGACLALLGALGALIYLPHLGDYPLADPWEPHYTQVAWEMWQRDTWLRPWYRGIEQWWSKPIGMLWLLRVSLTALVLPTPDLLQGAWAARLPFALCAICGGLLHFDWCRRLYGPRIALLAAVVVMTAPQYVLVGRLVMADMILVVPYAASLGYLAVGLFANPTDASVSPHPRWPFVLFWLLQGLAILAKGFVAPVLAVLVIAAFGVLTFRWQDHASALAAVRDRWLRYALKRGSAMVVALLVAWLLVRWAADWNAEQRFLWQALVAAAVALTTCACFGELPPLFCLWQWLRRIHAGWGLVICLAVAGPWFAFMTWAYGWPYWREFIFYHHLGRALGTIDKPAASCVFYIKQILFGFFPWSALLPGSLMLFARRCRTHGRHTQMRDMFFSLAILVPWTFFSLSQSKFAHYILPVLPFLAIPVAWALSGGEDSSWTGAARRPRWRVPGGDAALFGLVALLVFAVVAEDIVHDFRTLLRLAFYYGDRLGPADYHPSLVLRWLLAPAGIAVATWLVVPRILSWQRLLLGGGAFALAVYIGWFMLPAMNNTYTYAPFVAAYNTLARPGELIAEYNTWHQPSRSVIFGFANRAQHLRGELDSKNFLRHPARKFIITERHQTATLRQIARSVGKQLFVVFTGHPTAVLLSDVPNPDDQAHISENVLTQLPAGTEEVNVRFGQHVVLLGWRMARAPVDRGEAAAITLYWQVDGPVTRDWEIFVHGEDPTGIAKRLRADHIPMGGLYALGQWHVGEIVADTFDMSVPRRYGASHFDVWIGLFSGDERAPAMQSPLVDGRNRARGPRVFVR